MEWDERAELAHDTLCDEWFSKFRAQRGPIIANWVSSFRSGHPSAIVEDHCGSFNWSCRVRFKDSVEWLVRFAVPRRVMDGDEKLHREVAVMCLVREKNKDPGAQGSCLGTVERQCSRVRALYHDGIHSGRRMPRSSLARGA